MLEQVTRHRLIGLLAAAACDGALVLTDAQCDRVEAAATTWLAHDVRIERLALDAVRVLDSAGFEFRVLKGVPLANSVYPTPSWRVFGDLDLLVPSGQFSEAARALGVAFGVEREVPELKPGFDERFGREILLRVGKLELDLHRTLVDGPYGQCVHLPDLFEAPQYFTLAGHAVPALGRTAQFLHACLAARLADWPPRLMTQRDVAQLLLRGDVDLGAVREMATRWSATAVIASAVRTAWDQFDITESHPVADWAASEMKVSRRDRLMLRSYDGAGRGYRSHLASMLVIRGLRPRLSYLDAIVRPSGDYLAVRGLTQGDRWRRLVTRRELPRRSRRVP